MDHGFFWFPSVIDWSNNQLPCSNRDSASSPPRAVAVIQSIPEWTRVALLGMKSVNLTPPLNVVARERLAVIRESRLLPYYWHGSRQEDRATTRRGALKSGLQGETLQTAGRVAGCLCSNNHAPWDESQRERNSAPGIGVSWGLLDARCFMLAFLNLTWYGSRRRGKHSAPQSAGV